MLRPDIQWRNPVMFTVEVGTALTLIYTVAKLLGCSITAGTLYLLALDGWLVATLLFANFASSIAEARGKAQADALRQTRRSTPARRLRRDGSIETTVSTALRSGDRVEIVAGEAIPSDGEIIEGVASIDESAITGESAPVIREAGGDRSGVTGGTRVLSDRIVVEITANPGSSFLDRMIALVEGAIRQRTPNEIALSLVLAAFTLIFLIVTATLWPMSLHAEKYMTDFTGKPAHSLGTDVPTLVALLVCLIPTTIGALLAAIGIAGMDRALRANIIAKSGKAVEVAGDVDTLLLDKTGTITVGNRRATQFVPFGDFTAAEVGRLASLASGADQTPEGKSIVELFQKFDGSGSGIQRRAVKAAMAGGPAVPSGARFIPFTAQTRMSGIDLPDGRQIRKGAPDAILRHIHVQRGDGAGGGRRPGGRHRRQGRYAVIGQRGQPAGRHGRVGRHPQARHRRAIRAAAANGTADRDGYGRQPAHGQGDCSAGGRGRFHRRGDPRGQARLYSQRTGGRQAGGHDGRRHQRRPRPGPGRRRRGHEFRHSGRQRGRQHGRSRQRSHQADRGRRDRQTTLMTRGALTTFSVANDVAKYFAIVPAMFAGTLPWLKTVDIMNLHSPTSAILSAVIFNAIIIPLLIPIALKGVRYRPIGADALLRRNLLIWGLGGVIVPFVGIKLIDMALVAVHLLA